MKELTDRKILKTPRDLIDYYCMRCVVGINNCGINMSDCSRIREDIDYDDEMFTPSVMLKLMGERHEKQ